MAEINRPYIRDNNYCCSICNIAIIDVNGQKITFRSHYDRVHMIKSITFKPFITDEIKLVKKSGKLIEIMKLRNIKD